MSRFKANNKLRQVRTIVLLALSALGSEFALATTTACPTTTGTSLTTLNTDGGCFDTDKTFSSFSVSGTLAPSTGDIDLVASGGGYTGGTPPTGANPIDLAFSPDASTSGIWSVAKQTSSSGAFSYTAAVDPTQPGYEAPPAGMQWLITSITLGPGTANFTNADSKSTITITETFCLNQSTITVGCAGGTITETFTNSSSAGAITYGGSAGGTGTLTNGTLTFGTGFQFTQIAISDAITIASANGTSSLLTLMNDFGELQGLEPTPEPSSFVLLGTALAALGAFAFARRTS